MQLATAAAAAVKVLCNTQKPRSAMESGAPKLSGSQSNTGLSILRGPVVLFKLWRATKVDLRCDRRYARHLADAWFAALQENGRTWTAWYLVVIKKRTHWVCRMIHPCYIQFPLEKQMSSVVHARTTQFRLLQVRGLASASKEPGMSKLRNIPEITLGLCNLLP